MCVCVCVLYGMTSREKRFLRKIIRMRKEQNNNVDKPKIIYNEKQVCFILSMILLQICKYG